jgi:plastocyanin
VATGCGSDSNEGGGSKTDAASDQSTDRGKTETGSDSASPDAGEDAQEDAEAEEDASPDAEDDASDAAMDAPMEHEADHEEPVDSGIDASDAESDDAGVDASEDAPIDAPPDVAFDAPVDAPVDAPIDAPVDAPAEASVDAGKPVNGCTDADFTSNDLTDPGAAREIFFPKTAAPAQYSPRCIMIQAGQSVTWSGAFSSHPLEPAGGDPGTPIKLTNSGTSQSFTFSTAGTFGFDCQFHPSIMFGAIRVIP